MGKSKFKFKFEKNTVEVGELFQLAGCCLALTYPGSISYTTRIFLIKTQSVPCTVPSVSHDYTQIKPKVQKKNLKIVTLFLMFFQVRKIHVLTSNSSNLFKKKNSKQYRNFCLI